MHPCVCIRGICTYIYRYKYVCLCVRCATRWITFLSRTGLTSFSISQTLPASPFFVLYTASSGPPFSLSTGLFRSIGGPLCATLHTLRLKDGSQQLAHTASSCSLTITLFSLLLLLLLLLLVLFLK